MTEKRIQFGNEGEELVPGKTENLSSTYHKQGDAAHPHGKIDRGVDQAVPRSTEPRAAEPRSAEPLAGEQRGDRATFDPKTGAVHGSGANAGGGGTPREDYDRDSAGGERKPPVQAPRR